MTKCSEACGHCGRCDNEPEPPCCAWCGEPINDPWTDTHAPYCSPECALRAELDSPEDCERENTARALTRTERHQLAADHGVDTWEDYRGER